MPLQEEPEPKRKKPKTTVHTDSVTKPTSDNTKPTSSNTKKRQTSKKIVEEEDSQDSSYESPVDTNTSYNNRIEPVEPAYSLKLTIKQNAPELPEVHQLDHSDSEEEHSEDELMTHAAETINTFFEDIKIGLDLDILRDDELDVPGLDIDTSTESDDFTIHDRRRYLEVCWFSYDAYLDM